ncbi:28S ribosomal protein S6, mitochondrial-like [Xenia sp. Carnegie-2017]|uniref:28S ribosomal protein S6, mitochondrial-like n=1 Tax=Xenia sp. Carnegie-2017 TaxID=2897299 RepID=UPI001F04CE9C|nr:28S ribosomal protein S6, mitochondrial-like [Xenia sp. Carnegie-2017]
MPRYELSLITKALNNEGLANILRRVAVLVMEKGGVVRKMENLGQQELPYRMKAHNEWHTHGRYFVFDMDLGPSQIPLFEKELKLNSDLIRPRLIKQRPNRNLNKFCIAGQVTKVQIHENRF